MSNRSYFLEFQKYQLKYLKNVKWSNFVLHSQNVDVSFGHIYILKEERFRALTSDAKSSILQSQNLLYLLYHLILQFTQYLSFYFYIQLINMIYTIK